MSRSHKRSRGQVLVADAMLASIFLAMVFFVLLGTIEETTARAGNADRQISRKASLLAASDSLVLTAGQPRDWNEIPVIDDTNVKSLGLATSPSSLSIAKLQRFAQANSTNYSVLKSVMGLSESDAWVEVDFFENNTPAYKFGIHPANSETVGVIERLAILGQNIVVLRIEAGQ